MINGSHHFTGIIHRILSNITTEEAIALQFWATKLLTLRTSTKSPKQKLLDIIQLTKDAPILFPLIKKIAVELKKTGWDERSWKARIGMGAGLWATLLIAKAGAGLALLGGAIAVPLWIVFGSGDQFVKKLIQALKKKNATDDQDEIL